MLRKVQGVTFVAVMALLLFHCQSLQLSEAEAQSQHGHQSGMPGQSSVATPTPAASQITAEEPRFAQFRQKRVPPLGLDKVGVWIQSDSADSTLPYKFAKWFVADWKVAKQVSEKAGDRPVLIAFGARYMDRVEGGEWQSIPKIRGVVLDYETGQKRDRAEKELIRIYNYLHGKGYLVGVSSLGRPSSSLKANGVDFGSARLYCDFLMPQIYSRIWNNVSSETMRRYEEGLRAASVPVIPVIAYATTKNNPGKLMADEVIRNYRPLKLPSLVVWNVGKSDLAFWEALNSL